MKSTACEYEHAVAKGVRQGGWDEPLDESLGESLRGHLDSCEHCRGIAVTAGWLATLAEDARSDPALPEPGLIWLRARLEEVQKAEERAQRPLEIAHTAVVVVGAASIAGLWVSEGAPLQRWWLKFLAVLQDGQLHLTHIDFSSAGVSTIAFCLMLLALLLVLRPVFAED